MGMVVANWKGRECRWLLVSAVAVACGQELPTETTTAGPQEQTSAPGEASTSATTGPEVSPEGSDEGDTPPPPPGDTGDVGGTVDPDPTDCTFEVSHSMSEMIPTVAIVEWSSDLPGLDEATIEFGLTTDYGLTAPVDLNEPGHRTLLLGMKAAREYHFRIVASASGNECRSDDFVVTTGPAPNDLVPPDVVRENPDALADGYLLTEFWGTSGGPSFILDADNDFVWWYPTEDDVMRTRMSYDGKFMWLRNTAQQEGTGLVRRVTMDGLHEERFVLPATTHDLTVTPEGTLGLIAHADNGCDEILEFDPEDESATTLFSVEDAHGSTMCHVNAINYYAVDDTFTFSDYNQDCYVKITRDGELVWVLNGEQSDFTGTSWSRQHNFHMLAPDHLVLFSNGAPGQNSIVYEYQLDLAGMTATELWSYDGGVSATFGGDVQRLDNGNTLVTYSSAGIIHEVDEDGNLLQSLSWPVNNSVAYSMKRASLYGGPPPKVH